MNFDLENNARQTSNTASRNKENFAKENHTKSNAIEIPTISLPKGGGALKGIDEKFQVNASNGTASYSIPLPLSSGRNGLTPALSLSYNSGSGNSPFGIGWDIGLPAIQRKTDKKLPRYRDALDEDIFMFSGVEDLVPYLYEANNWASEEDSINGYSVKRYRPRIEGSFSKIEKITNKDHGVYWKVTTRENIATIFGRDTECRIADPEDQTRIFKWLPEFSYDDKGNWMLYEYKEDTNIDKDDNVTQQLRDSIPDKLHEQNRKNGNALYVNLYLKSISYGNRQPWYADPTKPFDPQLPDNTEHFFEVLFDYGDNDLAKPSTSENNPFTLDNYRFDAQSDFHAGFEIRTSRLCRRVLMFHHFKDEKQADGSSFGNDYLVKSLDFDYISSSINYSGVAEVTYLNTLTQSGYIRKTDGTYSKKSLPQVEFNYQQLIWNKEIKVVNEDSIINAPVGLTNDYQWVDFYGEGVSGIFIEQGEGWYYKSNLGVDEHDELQLAPAKIIASKPSFTGVNSGVLQLMDLDANGEKQVVINAPGIKGFFQLTDDNDWEPFCSFLQSVNIDLRDPYVRTIDLNGDGMPELVMTDENVFVWYASQGKTGYTAAEFASKTFDEEKGPAIVFADSLQTIFLADMSGDGITDIVRIRNGEICYWPNMGYGKFGAKVNMSNVPVFDLPDQFNPEYLHLADISGTGATDIIYTGKNICSAWLNLSGNEWSDGYEIETLPPVQHKSQLAVIDLLGTGTACIVWSSDLPGDAQLPMQYIDLMSSKKPHVMIKHVNNMGLETTVEYKSSTWFYLQDKIAGTPWITKLPFPVQVVASTTVEEKITNVIFTTQYSYHHGYYDHPEKEFRGFGRVDQQDTEQYDDWKLNAAGTKLDDSEPLFQKPVLTKTWYHTGAYLDKDKILTQFETEYWYNEMVRQGFPVVINEPALPDAQLKPAATISSINIIATLSADEWREAFRACKGMTLRQEVFALDAPSTNPTDDELKLQLTPYSVATHNCNIQLLQPRGDNLYAVFMMTESESIQFHYERNTKDPRVAHTLNVVIDDLGNVKEMASVVYGRNPDEAKSAFDELRNNVSDFSNDQQMQNAFNQNLDAAENAQQKILITYTRNSFTNDFITADDSQYRLRMAAQTETFELTGFNPASNIFLLKDFGNVLDDAGVANPTTELIQYLDDPDYTKKQRRLVEHVQTLYYDETILNPLPLYQLNSRGLIYQSYQLAFTLTMLTSLFENKLVAVPADAGYVNNNDNNWWIPSGITNYAKAGESIQVICSRFFTPISYTDAFNDVTIVGYYKDYFLFLQSVEDALQNVTSTGVFNFRTLAPSLLREVNANLSQVISDELGLPKAMALLGKDLNGDFQVESDPVDNLDGISEISEAENSDIQSFFNTEDSNQLTIIARRLLQNATARFVYDFDSYQLAIQSNKPVDPTVVAGILRETHADPDSKLQMSFEYTDGMGKVAMKKIQTNPGIAKKVVVQDDGSITVTVVDTSASDANPATLRWIGNGRTVLNNKGNPVKQYEPYFSITPFYEDAKELVESGVTPVLYYDPLSRNIMTELPDGNITSVVFDAWQETHYDQNDNVLKSDWYDERIVHPNPVIATPPEIDAANKTILHNDTPSIKISDSLGRMVLQLEDNGKDEKNKEKYYATYVELDIEGNAHNVIDAYGNTVMSYKYDMLGHRVYQNSMDAGRRWMLHNVDGKPVLNWDEKKQQFRYTYDSLRRPDKSFISINGNAEILFEKIIYGESLVKTDRSDVATWQEKNILGKPYQNYDAAGVVTNSLYDFKGNVLQTSRQIFEKYDDVNPADWTNALPLDPGNTYTSSSEYDALNRPWKITTPDNSVQYHLFNESRHLNKVLLNLQGEINMTLQDETFDALTANAKNLDVFVIGIDYNEKSQRKEITYGNNTITNYTYDEKTFRLSELTTTSQDGKTFYQGLKYTYDPVGNITQMRDDAQQTIYFGNAKVEPIHDYTYDAIYRLVRAIGREHIGQNQMQENNQNKNYRNFPFQQFNQGLPAATDSIAMRAYTQQYIYDAVGNIKSFAHQAKNPDNSLAGFTRTYFYNNNDTDRATCHVALDAIKNNRLLRTQINNVNIDYTFDVHGNMTSMPHLSRMDWNFKDELFATAQTVVYDGTPGTTYYVYDAEGIRVRKITNAQNSNTKTEERIYLGGYEVYRRFNGDITKPILERQTLHIMDNLSGDSGNKQRIAMVETKVVGDKNNSDASDSNKPYVRYQYNNHLGSSCLELNENLELISYEEYHPYGTTAYQAMNAEINPTAKRFRYTGLERDEENGFGYHNARYYVPWLGRWATPDPLFKENVDEFYLEGYRADRKNISKGTKSPAIQDFMSNTGKEKTAKFEAINSIYDYCKNNPLHFTDTNGKQEKEEPEYPELGVKVITTVVDAPLDYAKEYAEEHALEGVSKLKFLSTAAGVAGVGVEVAVAYHNEGARGAAQELGIGGGALILGTVIGGPVGFGVGLSIKFLGKPTANFLKNQVGLPAPDEEQREFAKNYPITSYKQEQQAKLEKFSKINLDAFREMIGVLGQHVRDLQAEFKDLKSQGFDVTYEDLSEARQFNLEYKLQEVADKYNKILRSSDLY